MKEVLEAIEEMKARLKKTGNIIIGHNDCWALVLVYKQLVDHSYQQPKWTRQTFFSNKHFVLEMMKEQRLDPCNQLWIDLLFSWAYKK